MNFSVAASGLPNGSCLYKMGRIEKLSGSTSEDDIQVIELLKNVYEKLK